MLGYEVKAWGVESCALNRRDANRLPRCFWRRASGLPHNGLHDDSLQNEDDSDGDDERQQDCHVHSVSLHAMLG
jgi:hypothetical protein